MSLIGWFMLGVLVGGLAIGLLLVWDSGFFKEGER